MKKSLWALGLLLLLGTAGIASADEGTYFQYQRPALDASFRERPAAFNRPGIYARHQDDRGRWADQDRRDRFRRDRDARDGFRRDRCDDRRSDRDGDRF